MTEPEVVALMKSSRSEEEWDANCDAVKAPGGVYPDFWYRAIVLSGVMSDTVRSWQKVSL